MADNETQIIAVEDYIQSLSPNANVSEKTIKGILADAGVERGSDYNTLSERQKDLILAYTYIRFASNPVRSQRVTDKDGDWEHSEGSEEWSRSQVQQFLIMARDLLAKWDITDPRTSLAPKWGMKGTGFRKIRRYKR